MAGGITVRQSAPPGPPAPFDPNLKPSGMTEQQLAGFNQEHERLHPEERFRSASRPGVPDTGHVTGAPPMPPGGAKGLAAPAVALPPSNYPAYRYHVTKAPTGIVVNDPDHEKGVCTGDGWSALPPPPKQVPGVADRLELLESLVQILAGQASGPDDDPVSCLERIIADRDDFAKKAASLAKGK